MVTIMVTMVSAPCSIAPFESNRGLDSPTREMPIYVQAAGGAAKTGLDYAGIGLGYAKRVRTFFRAHVMPLIQESTACEAAWQILVLLLP